MSKESLGTRRKLKKAKNFLSISQAPLVNSNMNSFLAEKLGRALRLAPLPPVPLPPQGGAGEVEQSQVAPAGFLRDRKRNAPWGPNLETK